MQALHPYAGGVGILRDDDAAVKRHFFLELENFILERDQVVIDLGIRLAVDLAGLIGCNLPLTQGFVGAACLGELSQQFAEAPPGLAAVEAGAEEAKIEPGPPAQR